MKNITKITIMVCLVCAIPALGVWPKEVETDSTGYWKVIMAEAVSEGYDGMYAVACVIRNRGGNLNAFCGAKRKDLDDFCKRQGVHYISLAKTIEKCVFEENGKDITLGATHFENVGTYGVPYWASEMRETVKIGGHIFYKEKARI